MEKLNFAKFYTYKELEDVLKAFAKEYPEEMKLKSLAKTDGGRDVYLVEITDNVNSPDSSKKPAYYIQSSVHAQEPAGGTISLHFIETLLTQKPDILKEVIFYIVPRVNPDGMEEVMLHNAFIRSKNSPNPRLKENYLKIKDMNGDGLTLYMRRKNPLGSYKEIAPGMMSLRKVGDTGDFYDVCPEGEFVNFNEGMELHELDWSDIMYDFNRSCAAGWEPLPNASEYPFRFPEMRAVSEFLVSHPNIFAGLDFHNGTHGILRPHMCEDSQLNPDDRNLIMTVGNLASEITGFPLIQEYRYGSEPYAIPGCSNRFAFDVLGISHYVVELGRGINDIGVDPIEFLQNPDRDAYEIPLIEYSKKEGYDAIHEFKPFKHPQLGDIEIGGVRFGLAGMQNPKSLEKIAPKTTEFMLKHASMSASLTIGNAECINVGGDIYRVRAQIKNLGVMGTKVIKGTDSYQAQYPVDIFIEEDTGIEILSRPNIYQIKQLDSMQGTFVEWFIKKDKDTKVTICAEHVKAKSAKITL